MFYKIAAIDGGQAGYTYDLYYRDILIDEGIKRIPDAVDIAWNHFNNFGKVF
jgi:hypothetical protein